MSNHENPTVHFSTIASSRDNAVQNWHQFSWTQLRDLLLEQGHFVTENKDVSLISPWQFKTTADDFTPRTTDDGKPWLIDSKPVVGRLASNVIGTSMLMFDFDGALSVSHAKSILGQWTHLGYTSYSHMSPNKDGKDCFRVILPLKHFVTAQQLVDRRKAIYAEIPGLDTSCLSLSRSFYVPSVMPNRKHLAQMWDNDGELFDVLEYDPEVYVPPVHTATYARPIDREKIISALKGVFLGNEPEWFMVACAMAANDFTLSDFCEVSIGGLMREKNQKQCADKWKGAQRSISRGHTPTVGYLVNVCKKHGTWESANQQKINKLRDDIATLRSAS